MEKYIILTVLLAWLGREVLHFFSMKKVKRVLDGMLDASLEAHKKTRKEKTEAYEELYRQYLKLRNPK